MRINLSLSFSSISRKYTLTADRRCSTTYPLIRHTRDDIIYNATKIITNSLNWNGRTGGMASVIYGSSCGRLAEERGQPSSMECLTNASVFLLLFFFIGRRQSSLRTLVLTHIHVVAAYTLPSPIHFIRK